MSKALGLLLLAAPVVYAVQMLRFRQAWNAATPHPATPDTSRPEQPAPPPPAERRHQAPYLSVLIAARNEAANLPLLLTDLQRQRLPASVFEVLVVDDHSTDATAEVVANAARTSSFSLRLLQLATLPGPVRTGKKAALEAAIAQANGAWVVCTDADCRVLPNWLLAHHQMQDATAHFVSGPVLLTGQGVLAALQGLELAGLVASGAAGILLHNPTMCNGANLSYRRASFAAVRGFSGNAHVASGDDEFLLHKLHAAYPAGIRFLKDRQAIVRTAAQPTLRQLLRQRVRWASKWQHYRTTAPRRLAVVVLAANVALAAGALALPWQPALGPWVLGSWVLKLGADVLFLLPVLHFFERRRWLAWVPVLQVAYAPYALLVGLAGYRGGYEWKGRQVKKQ
ncbi:glycosyltransferase [Hymenobacter tibetensis]|uniref:Glycosyltransferase n=1 Tax=Hymenobacter tibetensis TaxID=497967 RepID=A0ABY4D2J8_9BACT|nr:glycosyltransferase [Hymenobacter tibetensis]UOG76567.1 glycosyltransferase [Hymenobacter tibetensis]